MVRDAAGVLHTYYVCRTSPPAGLRGVSLISYRSPLGALASRSTSAAPSFARTDRRWSWGSAPGCVPFKQGAWDSRDSVFESKDFDTFTVVSLRELLAPAIDVDEKGPVAALLAAEEADNNVIEGMRRSVIRKMTLRDQPVLDQYQNNIFRLPLASQLLILEFRLEPGKLRRSSTVSDKSWMWCISKTMSGRWRAVLKAMAGFPTPEAG